MNSGGNLGQFDQEYPCIWDQPVGWLECVNTAPFGGLVLAALAIRKDASTVGRFATMLITS